MSNYLMQRDGFYYYRRRVPDYLVEYDKRKFIRTSLKTRDKREAIRKAAILNDFIEEYWQSLINDNTLDPNIAYKLAIKRAELHGFKYKSATEVSLEQVGTISERLVEATNAIDEPEAVSAILGGQTVPELSLEALWNEYYNFKKPDLIVKSKSQRERWINPRVRAYKTFAKVCDNISVNNITRNDIMAFRAWWSERLVEGNMAPNSANKDLTHLRSLLAFAQDNKEYITFDVNSLFARIRFKERDSERRPFATEFISSTLLNPKNLIGLNDECRLFLYAMADTGARPSELVGLNAQRGDIRLDAPIPYIHIRPDEHRELKNRYSQRQIPLVGASLYAFKQLPDGFQQYFQKPDQLSANLNGFLREHGLLPTDDHTVYSLRHSFEDRLSAVEPPEKIQSFLMGHKYRRERYGDGPTLYQKKNWLQKIAFSMPHG
ncbi:MAG: site-specific integrase [Cellvibrionaceae bacterium]